MKKITIGIISIIIVTFVFMFLNLNGKQDKLNAFLNSNHLKFESNKELIDYLEYSEHDNLNYKVQIFPNKIVFDDGANSVEKSLKDDLFYLSFAPYLNQTHPCTFHVPTGCQGELPKRKFDVKIRNNETGEILFDDEVETADNGFAGVWLPRNIEGSIEISYYDLKAVAIFLTEDDSPTCLTTLELL